MNSLPKTIKLAIYFLIGYGILVLVNACYYSYLYGTDFSVFPRAILRFIGVCVISLGLYRREKWALFLGLGLLTILVLASALSLFALFSPNTTFTLFEKLIPILAGIFALFALVLLSQSESRKAFQNN